MPWGKGWIPVLRVYSMGNGRDIKGIPQYKSATLQSPTQVFYFLMTRKCH
jgi:hypothetical protein